LLNIGDKSLPLLENILAGVIIILE